MITPNQIAGRYRRTDRNQHEDRDGVWAEDDLLGGPVRLLPIDALNLTAAPDQRAAARARVPLLGWSRRTRRVFGAPS